MTKYELKQKGRWVYIRPFPEPKLLAAIEKELTYTKAGAKFMPNPDWARVKLYQKGRGRFPIGLLHRVCKVFTNEGDWWQKQLNTPDLMGFSLKVKGLYDFQTKAVIAFILANGGILQMPTGSGKTRTALSIIDTLKMKTLVVVPTVYLKEQWEKQIPENVEVRTYQSLKSKKHLQQFGFIVFDECHNVAAKTLQLIGLNLKEEAVTLGLSATPFMRDDDNLKVESIIGPVVYKISLRQLIQEDYLVDALVHYHKLEHMENEFNNYSMMYHDYIVLNGIRNLKILMLAKESKGYTLILVKHIEHGEILMDLLNMHGLDVVFLNGSTKKKDRSIDHRIIIATSIFDEGVDIPRLKNLILAGGGKSAIKTTQRIGRVLRKFPGKEKAMVHDFADNCRWLDEHYKERRKLYEQDFEVVDVQ